MVSNNGSGLKFSVCAKESPYPMVQQTDCHFLELYRSDAGCAAFI